MEFNLVHYQGPAVAHLREQHDTEVVVELCGGRDRRSVGGQLAEGFRWWYGNLWWTSRTAMPDVEVGTEFLVSLNGRSAPVVVESTPDHTFRSGYEDGATAIQRCLKAGYSARGITLTARVYLGPKSGIKGSRRRCGPVLHQEERERVCPCRQTTGPTPSEATAPTSTRR